MAQTLLQIPTELKPPTGASAPVRPASAPSSCEHLAGSGGAVMGTSHRQKPVKELVGRVRAGLRELFALPDGYEVAARQRRHDGLLGRGHLRPDPRARSASQLRRVLLEVRRLHPGGSVPRRPDRRRAPTPGDAPDAARADPDAPMSSRWAHNETSTGVMVPVVRPAGIATMRSC